MPCIAGSHQDTSPCLLYSTLQAVVQEALTRLMAGRTVVVVAHRLSTIRDATRICVIAHGQVQEQGNHEELISSRGLYSQLIARQLTHSVSSPELSRGLSGSSLSGFSGDSTEGSRGPSLEAATGAQHTGGSGALSGGSRSSVTPRRS